MNGKNAPSNQDILSSVATLKVGYEELKGDLISVRSDLSTSFQALTTQLGDLKDAFNESRQFNWPLIFSAVLALGVIFGAAFTIADKNASILLAPVTTQNQVSIEDRTAIHRQIDKEAESIAYLAQDMRAFEAKSDATQKEIETQFRAAEQVSNLERANDRRHLKVVWDALSSMGAKLPLDPDSPFFHPSLMKNTE